MAEPTSNVMPTSNVAERDLNIKHRVSDSKFVQQVRGGNAIRMLVTEILGRSTPPPESFEIRDVLRVLRREQYAQRDETLRCRTCQRVLFGPVKNLNGSVTWKWLQGAECRCGSGA